MTNDQFMLQENKQERVGAIRSTLESTIEKLVASGRMPQEKVDEARQIAKKVVAKAEDASVHDFIGAAWQGDAGVQRLIGKFRR